jgi:hypothetical protein
LQASATHKSLGWTCCVRESLSSGSESWAHSILMHRCDSPRDGLRPDMGRWVWHSTGTGQPLPMGGHCVRSSARRRSLIQAIERGYHSAHSTCLHPFQLANHNRRIRTIDSTRASHRFVATTAQAALAGSDGAESGLLGTILVAIVVYGCGVVYHKSITCCSPTADNAKQCDGNANSYLKTTCDDVSQRAATGSNADFQVEGLARLRRQQLALHSLSTVGRTARSTRAVPNPYQTLPNRWGICKIWKS